jgi:hypothetical protein
MSSARSITAAVNPPRAVYLDYPLGHTSGKVNDADNQMSVMTDTLSAFETINAPGTIIDLPYQWRDDDVWKHSVMRPKPRQDSEDAPDKDAHNDDRVGRHSRPQYQNEDDAQAADANCPGCVFLEVQA